MSIHSPQRFFFFVVFLPRQVVRSIVLTFRAIFALPSGETDNVSVGGARVVSKLVITRSTKISTSTAVIVGLACNPNVVLHGSVLRQFVAVLRPLCTHVQHPLDGESRYQDI